MRGGTPRYAVEVPRWSIPAKLEAARSVTAGELREFQRSLLAATYSESLVHGNATPEEALAIVDSVARALPGRALTRAERAALAPRVACLPFEVELRAAQPAPNPDEPNAAIEAVFQIGPAASPGQTALVDVAAHIMSEPCFNQLRTREQLGYIVSAGSKEQV